MTPLLTCTLDILCNVRKIIIELKNRTNTDNASSKKTTYDLHPDYTCIYANINANTEKNTRHGATKIIMHNGVEIEHWIGFGDNTNNIIEFVKTVIQHNTESNEFPI